MEAKHANNDSQPTEYREIKMINETHYLKTRAKNEKQMHQS